MKLNNAEFWLMNNPVRAAIQRRYEGRWFEKLAFEPIRGGHALEVGCGRGIGVEIILDRFGAKRVDAFDLDERMVRRARRRFARRQEMPSFWVGSVTEIPAADATYDGVFDFGIVHHVPDWQSALDEIVRVLKPGGQLFFEEVLRDALARPAYRRFLDHPQDDRFDSATLIEEVEGRGIRVGEHVKRLFDDEYILAVGRKGA